MRARVERSHRSRRLEEGPGGQEGPAVVSRQGRDPATWRGRKLELVVEAVDDAREIYFGGQSVGKLGKFPPQYRSGLGETQRLAIPGEAIRFGGENVVAIRVCNIQARSGFNVAAPVLFAGDAAIRLGGKWETANGDDRGLGQQPIRPRSRPPPSPRSKTPPSSSAS